MNIAQLRARLAYRQGREHAWRLAGKTAHFWHNQKAIERARREILKWKALVFQAQEALAKAHPASVPVVMYDTIEVSQVPSNPQAVAGYVGGKWPTYWGLVKKFPNAHHLSIAVFSSENAECLDIETGDATPAEAPAWVRRQHARGVRRPVLYASLSVIPSVVNALANSGIHRWEYRLWSAHYTYVAHIDAGCDATQWTDKALGRNLDQSLCSPTFF